MELPQGEVDAIYEIIRGEFGQPESQVLDGSEPPNTQVEMDDNGMEGALCIVEIEQENFFDDFIDSDYEQDEVETGEQADTMQHASKFSFEHWYAEAHIDQQESDQADSDDLHSIKSDNEDEGDSTRDPIFNERVDMLDPHFVLAGMNNLADDEEWSQISLGCWYKLAAAGIIMSLGS
ncbi:Uncharacterized protein Fot_11033 [Forsythia ovata]|uniref:Uncharacterized protein n=1 Tax=Forsythia ovata TaxID=205694 RepID=A0ABD1WL82_9LAMI